MTQPSMLRDPATILGIAVVSTAVGMAFGYVRRGMIAEVQRHETQPHSEEWYEEVMGGTVLRSCGESLCSDCDELVVCYDGGKCPVSGDAHPPTLCSIEHGVK